MTRLAALTALAASIVIATAGTAQIVVAPSSAPPAPFVTPPLRPTEVATATPQVSPEIEHPIGPTEVALRMSEYGMPYPGMTLVAPTVFTLYGDGRAIYSTNGGAVRPGTRLDLRQALLTVGQVDELLADALGPGGLAGARAEYRFAETTDLTYTYFELHAAGLDKRVAAYAVGSVDPGPIPDADANRALGALAARLRNFDNDVALGRAIDAGVYEPESYEATLSVPSAGVQPTAVWPWQDLTPSDFGHAPDGNLVGAVSATHANTVLEAVPEQGFVAIGDDGLTYVFRLRPLLPDET